MSENSKIEWTDHTFNPWEGCQKVSAGCDHCYAETRNARFAGGQAVNWGPGAPRRRTSVSNWRKPLAWNMQNFVECEDCGHRGPGVPWRDVGPNMGIVDDGHQCGKCGSRSVELARARVFCASLADVFDNAVDPAWRRDLFDLIELTPNLDWLLLTKRIGNVATMVREAKCGDWLAGRSNVWLGATIVNQEEADRDIPKLLATEAQVRFLSMEPLLGPVDLTEAYLAAKLGAYPFKGVPREHRTKLVDLLDWVIVGGESGPGARPMHPSWVRGLRDQCATAGVPFLFKQWGEWLPAVDGRSILGKTLILEGAAPFTADPQWHGFEDGQQCARVGKKAAGRKLDGVQHDGYPVAP